jgi:hypothetical protein
MEDWCMETRRRKADPNPLVRTHGIDLQDAPNETGRSEVQPVVPQSEISDGCANPPEVRTGTILVAFAMVLGVAGYLVVAGHELAGSIIAVAGVRLFFSSRGQR